MDEVLAENDHQLLPPLSITDVFLADQACSDLCADFSLLLSDKASSSSFQQANNQRTTLALAEDESIFANDDSSVLQMSALGLPTSFITSSYTRNFTKKSSRTRRRKSVNVSDYPVTSEHTVNQGCFAEKNHDDNGTFPSDGATSAEDLPTSMEAETPFPVSSKYQELPIDTEPENHERLCPSLGENSGFSKLGLVDNVSGLVVDECVSDVNHEVSAFPWMPCWDDHYGRYYFCNHETMETTWEPPQGLELYAYIPTIEGMQDACDKMDGEFMELEEAIGCGELENHPAVVLNNSDATEALSTRNDYVGNVDQLLQAFEPCAELIKNDTGSYDKGRTESDRNCKAALGGRRKNRASKLKAKLEYQNVNTFAAMGDHSPSVLKYWIQRFHLFSKFNAGVKLDEEGWFSVTPEAIAKHQATRCNTGVIVDGFAGVGGNAIQFALAGHYVIAIDNDPKKIEYACHNASIYGVADRIDFLLGDFFHVSSSLQADVVFLSPPWGGPEYLDVKVYDIQTMLQPTDGMSLFKVAQAIAPNIIIFLPRNVNVDQLAELSLKSKPHLACEVERNYLNGKLKAVTAYYGVYGKQQ